MAIDVLSLRDDFNIGLKCYVNDKIAIVPLHTRDKDIELIKEILQVEIIKGSIMGTDLLGVFIIGKEKNILVPYLTLDKEVSNLEKQGLKVQKIDEEQTCLGNIVLFYKNKALISPETGENLRKAIEKLKYKIIEKKFSNVETPASFTVSRKNKLLTSLYGDDLELLEETLKVKSGETTINNGSPHLKSGILLNKNGILMGTQSTGTELTNIDSFFMEDD
jgi:translation initiation factor 6